MMLKLMFCVLAMFTLDRLMVCKKNQDLERKKCGNTFVEYELFYLFEI